MDIVLQIWGGLFYLLNKILFSVSEAKGNLLKAKLKMYAWSAYIIGAPAWIFLLVEKDNWIAASVEAGGIPAMLLGLYKTFFSY